jgi:RNA polymerase sigma factor (sigma-70 family)
MGGTDDVQLLDAWIAGDKHAGNELVQRYYGVLYRFFANKVGAEVDDLVQQTMTGLLTGCSRFEGRSTFRAYLLSIARYQLYEFVRRKQRSNAVLEYDTVSAFDLSPSPSTLASQRRDQTLLLEALRRIPLNFQIALELHYWEDLSGSELAEVLGVPVDTAYSRLRKARSLVKRQLRILSASGRSAPPALENALRELPKG